MHITEIGYFVIHKKASMASHTGFLIAIGAYQISARAGFGL